MPDTILRHNKGRAILWRFFVAWGSKLNAIGFLKSAPTHDTDGLVMLYCQRRPRAGPVSQQTQGGGVLFAGRYLVLMQIAPLFSVPRGKKGPSRCLPKRFACRLEMPKPWPDLQGQEGLTQADCRQKCFR